MTSQPSEEVPQETFEATWLGGPDDGKVITLPAETQGITIAEVPTIDWENKEPDFSETPIEVTYWYVPVYARYKRVPDGLAHTGYVLDFTSKRRV